MSENESEASTTVADGEPQLPSIIQTIDDSPLPYSAIVTILFFWAMISAGGVVVFAPVLAKINRNSNFAVPTFLFLVVPGYTSATCISVYLAFARHALLIRFGAGLLAVGITIFFAILVAQMDRRGDVFSTPFVRPFVVVSVGVMGAGALLSIARFAGWNIRCPSSPASVGSQFSIGQILQLTLVCAIGLAATKATALRILEWTYVGIIASLILGQAFAVVFLLIDRWSVTTRGILTFASVLLSLVLLTFRFGINNSGMILYGNAFVFCLSFLLTFNFMAMICFVLRERGYRLTRIVQTHRRSVVVPNRIDGVTGSHIEGERLERRRIRSTAGRPSAFDCRR